MWKLFEDNHKGETQSPVKVLKEVETRVLNFNLDKIYDKRWRQNR